MTRVEVFTRRQAEANGSGLLIRLALVTRSGASAPLAWHDDLQSAFRDVRIVVVGDAILDEYVTGDCTRLSPEAPVPILRVRSNLVFADSFEPGDARDWSRSQP